MEDFDKIIDSENLSEEELSEVLGGESSSSDCMCECWITNKNEY